MEQEQEQGEQSNTACYMGQKSTQHAAEQQQQHRRQAQQASIVATSVAQVRAPFGTAEGVPEEKKRGEGGGRQQVNV